MLRPSLDARHSRCEVAVARRREIEGIEKTDRRRCAAEKGRWGLKAGAFPIRRLELSRSRRPMGIDFRFAGCLDRFCGGIFQRLKVSGSIFQGGWACCDSWNSIGDCLLRPVSALQTSRDGKPRLSRLRVGWCWCEMWKGAIISYEEFQAATGVSRITAAVGR